MASIFQNALAARQQGYDQVADFRADQGRMRAGNALAMGQPREAANALYKAGELDAGEIVLQRGEARQMRQQAQQTAMQEQEAAQAKEAAQMRGMALVRAAQALRAIPAGQRAQALQTRVAPMLGRLGMDTSAFEGLTEEDLSDQGLDLFAGQVQRELEIVKGPDGSFSAVDKGTGEIVNQYQAPRYQALSPGQSLVEIGGGSEGAPSGGGAGGGFDAFYDGYLRGVEGGFAADDGNGAPVNFGINQGANPDIDVRNLTPERAKQLMYERYWAPSGADQLPDGLAQVHADTAINMGLGAAQQLLNQSGGDPNRYLELRAQRYRDIARTDPSKARYLNTWMRRNEQLAQFIGGGMGNQPASARVIAQGAPKPGYRMLSPEEVTQRGLSPGMYQEGPEGQLSRIADPSSRPPTEGQINGASLAYAAFGGNERLNELAKQGIFKPSSAVESLIQPDSNGLVKIVARNPQDRRFIQAALEFIAPVLRKDTGAAVTYNEFMFYKDMLIPAFEDDPALLWQKAQARDRTLRRIYGSSRRAYDQEYGAPGKWQVLTDPRAKPQSGGQSGGSQRATTPNSAQKMSDDELRAKLGL